MSGGGVQEPDGIERVMPDDDVVLRAYQEHHPEATAAELRAVRVILNLLHEQEERPS